MQSQRVRRKVLSDRLLDDAQSLHEKSLAINRELKAEVSVANCLLRLAMILKSKGDLITAQLYCREAATLAESSSIPTVLAALDILAEVAYQEGDKDSARSFYEKCLSLAKSINYKAVQVDIAIKLAVVINECGDIASAKSVLEEFVPVAVDLQSPAELFTISALLARFAHSQQEYNIAIAYLYACLTIIHQTGTEAAQVPVLLELISVSIDSAKMRFAACLLGLIDGILSRNSDAPTSDISETYAENIRKVQTSLGKRTFQQIRAEGSAIISEKMLEYVITKIKVENAAL